MGKIKDKISAEGAAYIAIALFGPPIVLLGVIWSEIGLPLWNLIDSKVEKKPIWALLAMAAYIVGIETAYIIHLSKKLNPSLIDRFGVYWTRKKFEPRCPKCKRALEYKEQGTGMATGTFRNPLQPNKTQKSVQKRPGTFKYWCIHCKEYFDLRDEDGNLLTRTAAVAILKTKPNVSNFL
jgi:hypothetical protein